MGYYICGIYERRPEMCRRYPELGSYQPESCTYYFADGKRKGFCDPECGAACCFLPRQGGEPGAPALPEIAGGEPCKYIIYVEQHPAMSGDGGGDTEPREDRGGDREESDPVESVLAEMGVRKGGRSRSA